MGQVKARAQDEEERGSEGEGHSFEEIDKMSLWSLSPGFWVLSVVLLLGSRDRRCCIMSVKAKKKKRERKVGMGVGARPMPFREW